MDPSPEILERVGREVLETMAFMFVMPGMESEEEKGPYSTVLVEFSGHAKGLLVLQMPDEILPELAANMLGDDEAEPEPGQQMDALGELANVICGNLLAEMAGPEPVFDLVSPVIITDVSELEKKIGSGKKTRAFLPLEEGWVELALVLLD